MTFREYMRFLSPSKVSLMSTSSSKNSWQKEITELSDPNNNFSILRPYLPDVRFSILVELLFTTDLLDFYDQNTISEATVKSFHPTVTTLSFGKLVDTTLSINKTFSSSNNKTEIKSVLSL